MRQRDALLYLHGDHLSSTVLETSDAGVVTTDERYYAYGRQRDTGAVVTDHRFTGQKLDATGLYYYNARYYDPEIGQFISPDPFVPDPSHLFAYNRYMYVAGNPMRLTDSSGHFWETVADVVSVGYDVYDIYQNGLTWSSGGALVVDVAGAAIPFVPSAGTCVRWCDDAWQYGNKAAGWVGDKADEGVEAAKNLLGMGDEAASAAKVGADCLTPNSFSAETLVMTPSGLKPIAELVEGELVLAYNEATGEIGAYPIVDIISHVDPEIVFLTIDGETLETTAEHPFYKLESAPPALSEVERWLAVGQTEGRWTDAIEFEVGDRIWKADGTNGIVQVVTVVLAERRMYNLTCAFTPIRVDHRDYELFGLLP
jgi:RHS repeat-associated protein